MTDKTPIVVVLTRHPEDIGIVESALAETGVIPVSAQIESCDALRGALECRSVELIVVSVDRFPETIADVVELRDVYCPEIPIVGLQSTVDEAGLQKAMGAGANDLVSAAARSRMRAVFARELRTLRMERALNSRIVLTKTIPVLRDTGNEYPGTGTAEVSDGVIRRIDRAWLRIFGLADRSEAVGHAISEQFAAESGKAVEGALLAAVNGKWPVGERLTAKALGDGQVTLEIEQAANDGALRLRVRPVAASLEMAPPSTSSENPVKVADLMPMRGRDDIVATIRKRLAERPASGLYALAYIRPDRVSEIRHAVGVLSVEQVLGKFAATVGALLHPDDVAGRLDETVILALLARGNERGAQHWAQAVVDKVRNEVFSAGERSISITCTVGICVVRTAHSGLEEILDAAMEAYAEGRRNSGNSVVLDKAGEDDARMREVDELWAGRIRSALDNNRFRLAQLPIVPLRGEASGYVDLLIRMLGEDGEELLPADFLPTARRRHLMGAIDCWVIDKAMIHAGREDVQCAFVRLSTQSIIDSGLVTKIERYRNKHGIDRKKMCFQITVDSAESYVHQIRALADDLRAAGYRIALEHYPANRQGHQILDMHKPDFVKIDGEFMHAVASDSKYQASVQSVVNAARERGIQTIAERVEFADTMAVLYRLGVHFMQGNYVQEPEIVLVQAG